MPEPNRAVSVAYGGYLATVAAVPPMDNAVERRKPPVLPAPAGAAPASAPTRAAPTPAAAPAP